MERYSEYFENLNDLFSQFSDELSSSFSKVNAGLGAIATSLSAQRNSYSIQNSSLARTSNEVRSLNKGLAKTGNLLNRTVIKPISVIGRLLRDRVIKPLQNLTLSQKFGTIAFLGALGSLVALIQGSIKTRARATAGGLTPREQAAMEYANKQSGLTVSTQGYMAAVNAPSQWGKTFGALSQWGITKETSPLESLNKIFTAIKNKDKFTELQQKAVEALFGFNPYNVSSSMIGDWGKYYGKEFERQGKRNLGEELRLEQVTNDFFSALKSLALALASKVTPYLNQNLEKFTKWIDQIDFDKVFEKIKRSIESLIKTLNDLADSKLGRFIQNTGGQVREGKRVEKESSQWFEQREEFKKRFVEDAKKYFAVGNKGIDMIKLSEYMVSPSYRNAPSEYQEEFFPNAVVNKLSAGLKIYIDGVEVNASSASVLGAQSPAR